MIEYLAETLRLLKGVMSDTTALKDNVVENVRQKILDCEEVIGEVNVELTKVKEVKPADNSKGQKISFRDKDRLSPTKEMKRRQNFLSSFPPSTPTRSSMITVADFRKK